MTQKRPNLFVPARCRVDADRFHWAKVKVPTKGFPILRQVLGERNLRSIPLGGVFDLEKLGGQEAKHAGENHVGENFAGCVVGHDGVVVGLAGEADFVLGRGELLGELHHVLVGLEVGVLLGDDHEAGERAAEAGFSGEEAFHRVTIGGIGGDGGGGGGGDVAGFDHGLERGALVLHVALSGLDEVGDEIVTALELNIDLGEGVLEAIAKGDEAVVDAGDPKAGDQEDGEDNAEDDEDEHGRVGFESGSAEFRTWWAARMNLVGR